MNLRNVLFVVSAVVGLTGAVSAQQASSKGSKAPAKTQAKTVTITGCVAQGIDADHYVLANAVRSQQPPASAAKTGASPTVRSDKAGASDRTGPYDLQGGEFKAHLGHTVEVTGTSGSTGPATNAPSSDGTTEKLPLPRFNVLSVKMLSPDCS